MRMRSYYSHHRPRFPREAQGSSFRKMRESLDEEPPQPLQPEHACKIARQTPAGHTRQWWYHITDSSSRARDQSSWRKSATPVPAQASSRASFPCHALRKESPRTRDMGPGQEWRLQDKKDGDGIGIHLRYRLGQSPICHIHHRERRSHSTKLRTWFVHDSIWMSKSSQSWCPPDLPWQRDLVAKTDVSKQGCHENWCIVPTVSTIFILSLSFLHRIKKKNDIAIHQS